MWLPAEDLEPLNRQIVTLEQDLLAVFRKRRPLETILESETLSELCRIIDENPRQAVLMTRIKSSHAMTPRHAINVLLLARAWAVSEHRLGDRLHAFSLAALFHDLGHWRPDDLVYTFEQFTHDEYRRMQAHPRLEEPALEQIDPEIISWIAQHHEQPDGRGYPEGIDDPHPLSQLIRIADCFDGLTTPRRFRPAYTPHEAMNLMRRWSGRRIHEGLYASFEVFMGKVPSGTLVSLEGRRGTVIDSEEESTRVLMLTDADGDPLGEPEIQSVRTDEIGREERHWYNVRLPDQWRNLRPDLLGLPRSYL